MKVNNFRIGNLITETNIGITNINVLDLENINNGDVNYKLIPLTEEWLLKFGFINLGVYEEWFRFRLESIRIEKTISLGFIFNFDDGEDYVKIRYVHQLQNLYFALTNEELTIKQ